ncbi:helix-turn-helix transcriptional regulator [Shewanella sp. 4t3-1-2LB]|uniref:helix-turn-helix domain-containing protein n=1 Tax=Shewanella sp. 4t3-1-2LB TaxID=2817682 RepID=UPI001A994897|nr:helix-turn-helix transcriptional regulator [Shewanella sp. 4t3-1-2LB]MBO1271123.1 helix-turn-helix transcriptional regulator [Shewanella sp. 4t3-1-2LB]
MQFSNPFPERLKSARTRAGISQKELGIRIGMEPSSASGRMNHYEKGRHVPDVSTLKRLAEELDVPLNYFFCETDIMAEFVLLFDSLSEEKQRELIEKVKKENHKS